MAQTDDLLVNWSNTLRTQEKGAIMVASKKAVTLKTAGYSRSDANEILMADFQSEKIVSAALNEVYPQAAAPVQRKAMIVPTSYSEVAGFVEDALKNMGPMEFTKAVTEGDCAIVKTAKKYTQSLYRVAQMAHAGDSNAMQNLHEALAPWFEEAMSGAVLAANHDPGQVLPENATEYTVMSSTEQARVCIASGKSSGARFTRGRYELFGLADEHLVRVSNLISPYQRLQRAISRS